jgi:hypothetical protein
MTDQPSAAARGGAPRTGRRPHTAHGVALVTGVLALALAACGGGTGTASPNTSAGPSAGARADRTPPGAFGTVAEVGNGNIEVQNPANGQVTVNYNGSTTFTNTVSAGLSDVAAGQCLTVAGNPGGSAGGPVTARSVTIEAAPANNGVCTAGFGAGGGFGGRAQGGRGQGGAPGGGNGGGSRRPRPSGTNRPNAAPVSGAVTAVNPNGFTVSGKNRSGATTTTTVTVDPSTTYTKQVRADASALAVGECVAALGSSDQTGAVTAKSITISRPNTGGTCYGRMGGGGNGGGANGAPGNGSGSGGNG